MGWGPGPSFLEPPKSLETPLFETFTAKYRLGGGAETLIDVGFINGQKLKGVETSILVTSTAATMTTDVVHIGQIKCHSSCIIKNVLIIFF